MFGELLPARRGGSGGGCCAATARLLVVVGSSLQVWPVAGLPGETVRAGGVVANRVNLGETRTTRRRGARPRAIQVELAALSSELGAHDLGAGLAAR